MTLARFLQSVDLFLLTILARSLLITGGLKWRNVWRSGGFVASFRSEGTVAVSLFNFKYILFAFKIAHPVLESVLNFGRLVLLDPRPN